MKKIVSALCVGILIGAGVTTLADGKGDWPWGDEHEAVAAAPKSHKVLLENEHVRVLEVVIQPGEKEPMHTHPWPSAMIVDQAARIRYFNAEGKAVFEHPADRPLPTEITANWMGPEGLHAVECIDDRPFHAIRVELKQLAGQ